VVRWVFQAGWPGLGGPDGLLMVCADEKASGIFDLEHQIAQAHVSRADSEDVLKGNNHWSRQDFDSKAPGLEWQAYFSAAGLDGQKRFVVWHPSAVTGLSALARKVPLATWKDYLTLRAIERYGNVLPRAFVEERFAFYGTTLTGTPRLRERWKRAVTATDAALGEVVGKMYVERYFPPAEKARAEETADLKARIEVLEAAPASSPREPWPRCLRRSGRD